MSDHLDGDWRVWNARLVADVSILEDLLRNGLAALPVMGETFNAMGLLVAEWQRALIEFGMAHRDRLPPDAVDRLGQMVRQLGPLGAALQGLPELVNQQRGRRPS